jgi:type II secretory pathway component PulF
METATLDDLMAMNEQLAALVAAGVPLDVGLSNRGATEALEKINATVARRVSRGATLATALESAEESVPAAYGRMMQAAIRSGQLSEALAGSNRVAESIDESRNTVRLAFVYPLTICFLAYLGLVAFCLYFVPTMESIADTFPNGPGPGLSVLRALRENLPYWVAVPPVLLALFVTRQLLIFDQRSANFAANLATLLSEGTPLAEGLMLAADAFGDSQLRAAANSMAERLRSGEPARNDNA